MAISMLLLLPISTCTYSRRELLESLVQPRKEKAARRGSMLMIWNMPLVPTVRLRLTLASRISSSDGSRSTAGAGTGL